MCQLWDQDTLNQLLMSCSKTFSAVYAVFDVLDECNDSHQNEVSVLFVKLHQSAYRLLISFRPHLKKLRETMGHDIQIVEVSAKTSDLNYVTERLELRGNKSSKLKEECTRLVKDVQGT